jgi:LPXTG-site transpeptidase (sortase) family protein
VIENIGVDAPVRTFGLDANSIPEVPVGADAAQIVAWYDFSAEPGTGSNAVFAGHVTWYGQAVFYRLGQLERDDTLILAGVDGTELIYTLTRDPFEVDPYDRESLQLMAATDEDVITLITCGGTWLPNPNDPVAGGDYSTRLVVRAARLDTDESTAAHLPGS